MLTPWGLPGSSSRNPTRPATVMPIQTAESLLQAMRESELFNPEQLDRFARVLAPLGDDTQVLCRYLIQHEDVPAYQLRKLIHGKTAELIIGPYVVLDKLGEGGMGKVYKARDTRSGRVVALKVIRPHLLSNALVRARYSREVQTALSLNHPNIAAAYEAGEAGDRHYLALEFVDGLDLARLVRGHGTLTIPEACEYVRQAALGLQHAHDRGFVHRDIKPSNILVSGERHHVAATEPACVKILDMGLVRSVGFEEGFGGTELTRDGTVVGTPDYMAPEQAKNSSTVDHRADLYSLGATFYLLLTGKPPFPEGTAIEKILKHQGDRPPNLQKLRPDTPDELVRIVTRLLSKKPADRYATAQDLAEALLPLTLFPKEPAVAASAETPDPVMSSSSLHPVHAILPPEDVTAADAPSPPETQRQSTNLDRVSDPTPRPRPRPAPARRSTTKRARDKEPTRASLFWRWVLLAAIVLAMLGTVLATIIAIAFWYAGRR